MTDQLSRGLRIRLVVLTLISLSGAFALQLGGCRDGDCTRTLGDVPKVFVNRGVRLDAPPYLDRMVEYPVVTGAVIYGASAVGRDPRSFMLAVGAVNAALALGVTMLLARMAPARAWRWAAALPLVLYGAHNWDLVAIAPLVAALYAFERRSDRLAGTLVAIAASAKLFPGLLLPVLAAVRWREGDRAGARRFVGAGVAVTLLLNLPVLLAAPDGWWGPFRYHGARAATWATPWYYLFRIPVLDDVVDIRDPAVGTLISVTSLVAGSVFLTVRAMRANASAARLAAFATVLFLLSGKIFSPGYDLWLVPFFVLLPLSNAHWFVFCAVDLGIYVVTYGMLQDALSREHVGLLGVLVFVRIAVLVWVAVRALLPLEDAAPEPREDRLPAAVGNEAAR
jgi:uncharacterized membrane protein